jgi:hypothetical protein
MNFEEIREITSKSFIFYSFFWKTNGSVIVDHAILGGGLKNYSNNPHKFVEYCRSKKNSEVLKIIGFL